MELHVTEQGIQVALLVPRQRIDTVTAPNLRASLDELCTQGIGHFVIDLSHVPFLDSAGLAMLLSLLKWARQRGGDVRLVWPNEIEARRLLQLTKFDRVFVIADTSGAAIDTF